MSTSPIFEVTRKAFARSSNRVITNLNTNLLEQKAAGRVQLNSSKYRFDPYGMTVLESREYPTPSTTTAAIFRAAATPLKQQPPTPTYVPLAAAPVARRIPQPAPAVSPQYTRPPVHAQPIDEVAKSETPTPAPINLDAAVHHPVRSNHVVCRVLVEFKRGDDVYASHYNLRVGDYVIVQGDRGEDMGVVAQVLPVRGFSLAPILDVASQEQTDTLLSLRRQEAGAVRLCQQRVREHGLHSRMKVEDVEFQYDGNKVTIYYSSPCSVDFRQL
eukprot:PhM_4_TR13684/c1_g2_i1/m.75366